MLAMIRDALRAGAKPAAGVQGKVQGKIQGRIPAGTAGKVRALLRADGSFSASDLGRKLHLSERAVRKHCAALQADGLLRRVGSDKSGHWSVF